MIESSGSPRFLLKAAEQVGIFTGGGANQFYSDVAAQALVTRPIDFPHPARADFFEDPVVPDKPASHKEKCRGAPCVAC
jgi:hypothetical protein